MAVSRSDARTSAHRRASRRDIEWVSDGVIVDRRLGSAATTAQVHPAAFTSGLMRAAERQALPYGMGQVTGLARDRNSGRVAGVIVGGEILEGDAVVIAMGPWSVAGGGMARASGDLRPERAQPRVRDGSSGSARGAVSRISGGGRRHACAGSISAARRHHLRMRHLERKPAARRSRGCRARSGGDRAPARDVSGALAAARRSQGACAPGVLSPGRARRPAADRADRRRRERLCRDRPQRLGHPQRARDRGGDGRSDRRRRGKHRPRALRSRPIAAARSGTLAGRGDCRPLIASRRRRSRRPCRRS